MDLGLRRDEEFARQAFERYLENKGVHEQDWKKGDEPPDCYLTAGGEDFAVEITTLMEQVATPRRPVSKKGIYESAQRLVWDIEVEALKLGILQGQYYVGIFYETDFYGEEKKLKEFILDYIQNTQLDLEAYSRIEVDYEDYSEEYGSISKESRQGNSVELGSLAGAKFRGVAKNEAYERMQYWITEKCIKLAEFDQPKILILINEYTYGINPTFYKQHISSVKDVEDFHTISVVHGSSNYVLHSQNPDWT